jgi:hypothetical protein
MVKIKNSKQGRLRQGDIYKNVEYVEYIVEKEGNLEISKISFPFIIVLTQDCDLEQDYKVRWAIKKPSNSDKRLFSVIVAPLYNEEHFYIGEHLKDLGYEMEKIKKTGTKGELIGKNEIPRYHYVKFPPITPIANSIIDFKHYFSVNGEYLKRMKSTNYVCQIAELYRESISQRFANYLARIGLP